MQLSRGLATINSSYSDTIILAICVSLGGAGLLVLATFAITKYRLRRELLIAQDTLPRPFEITIPAATITNTWMRARNLVSLPMRTGSPISYGQRGKSAMGREDTSTRLVPLRAGSTPTSAITTPGLFQPCSSRTTHIQPMLSNAPLLSQSGSGAQPGQSSSSCQIDTQLQGDAGVSTFPSASICERRSAKHALWLSRSASELYSASIPVPHHQQLPSGGYTPPLGRRPKLSVDTRVRPTNHLRQSRSVSHIVRVGSARLDSEENSGGAAAFQHEDASVMKELPPPYREVVLSS